TTRAPDASAFRPDPTPNSPTGTPRAPNGRSRQCRNRARGRIRRQATAGYHRETMRSEEPVDASDKEGAVAAGTIAAAALDAIRHLAILVIGDHGCILAWNEGARQLSGYSEPEAVRQSYAFLDARTDEADLSRILSTAGEHGRFRRQRWWRLR